MNEPTRPYTRSIHTPPTTRRQAAGTASTSARRDMYAPPARLVYVTGLTRIRHAADSYTSPPLTRIRHAADSYTPFLRPADETEKTCPHPA